MYKLEHPEYLWFLSLIPAFITVLVIYRFWQLRAQKKFGDKSMLLNMTNGVNRTRPLLKNIFLLLAFASLIIALSNPKVGTKMETVKRKGVDIVFALDVSKSMLAEDVNPNRLEKAKYVIGKTIDELKGDRIGIILYAGSAYPLLPITTDYAAAKLKLDIVNANLVPSSGTALNDALKFSMQYYNDDSQKNRLLVMLSDGEDHEEGWEETAQELKDGGILIATVGLGSEKGAPIPIKNGSKISGYKKDNNGEVVVTKRSAATLKKIAVRTGGVYLDGNNTSSALSGLQETIDNMEKTEFESKQVTGYQDQFQWFLGLALLFLVLDLLISERKSFWMEKIGLK